MGDFISAILAGIGAWFVIGTVGFWIMSVVLFGLLTWFTEDDKDFMAAIFIGGFIWIASSVNEWSILANPLLWLKWLAIYLVVGCVWSFIKWFSFLHRAKDSLRGLKESFHEKRPTAKTKHAQLSFTTDEWDKLTQGRPSEWEKDIFKLFAEYVYHNNYVNRFIGKDGQYMSEETIKTPADLIPTVKNRFGDLVRWIIWWPMSAVWTLLNDPIRRIAEFIVRSLKTSYTKVADSVFGNEI